MSRLRFTEGLKENILQVVSRKPSKDLSDPIAKAEVTKDALMMGPKAAAEKHDVSVSTASKLKNGKNAPTDPKEHAEYALAIFEGLEEARSAGLEVFMFCQGLLMENSGAALRKLQQERPEELSKVMHDMMRSVDVTIPKQNLIAAIHGDVNENKAVFVSEAVPRSSAQYERVTVERDREGVIIDAE